MKYRAILDEELKNMDRPPKDGREVLVHYNEISSCARYSDGWYWDDGSKITRPDLYKGWTGFPRLEEVK